MKFDTLIIGGGLAAHACGIRLQKAGQNTAIISAGQSTLPFFSGAFGFLSKLPDGTVVDNPLDAIPLLPANHPYSKIGIAGLERHIRTVRDFLADMGEPLQGASEANGWRFTAGGTMKRAWASLPDTALFPSRDSFSHRKLVIVDIPGFWDFFPAFITGSLEKTGRTCRTVTVSIPATDDLAGSSSVIRPISLAKLFEDPEVLEDFCKEVSVRVQEGEALILPQVFGLKSSGILDRVRALIPSEIIFIGTATPTVPGLRLQSLLRSAYEEAGGTFMPASVRSGAVSDCLVGSLVLDGTAIDSEADNYVLATGSFVSKGLASTRDEVSESVFGLDTRFDPDRNGWFGTGPGSRHGYVSFGVGTDREFHPLMDGSPVQNLYAAGSVLAGADTLFEGSGAGVAVFSALSVAENILRSASK